MFIMRKALIIIFMLFLPRLNIIIKVGFFVFIQSLYYLYLILVRPLEKAKDNIIDVINEMLILLLVTMLFKYNKEPDWNSSSKMVFFMSISIVNLIVSIICISKKNILIFLTFLLVDLLIKLIKLWINIKNKINPELNHARNEVIINLSYLSSFYLN